MNDGLSPIGFESTAVGVASHRTLVPRQLSRPQKAAIIVRLLVAEGAKLPLDSLDDATQAALTEQMAGLRLIDRATLQAVIEEFSEELDAIGLSLPGGLAGALDVLDGHISAATATRLRREAGVAAKGDPWERIAGLEVDRLVKVLEEESVEVGAILLSKIEVSKAALLLAEVTGERQRALSYAIARTGRVAPWTVDRIGLSLAAQLDSDPVSAFDAAPVARVGAILNSSRAVVRDEVLDGLDQEDAAFAAEVRRAIFTFSNLRQRLSPTDVPRVMKGIDQAELVTALAYAATTPDAAEVPEFVLSNLGRRMAEQIREEMTEAGDVKTDDGEAAMLSIVTEVRRMADAGEVLLVAGDE